MRTTEEQDRLDAEVAVRIFGFWMETDEHGPQWWGPHQAMPGEKSYASCSMPRNLYGHSYRSGNGLPFFSTDLDAAWAVIEKTRERFSSRHAFVEALRQGMPTASTGEAIDPAWWIFSLTPELICRAALAAVSPVRPM